jgi:hypothetical protein
LENGTQDTTLITDNITVPNSCCWQTCDYISGNGCINRLEYVVGQSAVTFASATIFIALLQVCMSMVVFTVCVSTQSLHQIGPLLTLTV